ncbi:ATP-binding protein [Streptomyces sp. 549]|uniref:ATP-binding protein n=1 Tax=Streptomyces sp. 549 TaxID=3049076 RepID=UPI0024C3D83F|nr:ATP-binding protein [Streptomyces sp. 549]MDK1474844.1 ATP-binding protein [Streptomyces sp. 549]
MTTFSAVPPHRPPHRTPPLPLRDQTFRLIAPNVPVAARAARDMVAALLHSSDRPELADVARLLVSEVVTNAYRHTIAPRLTLDATVGTSGLLVAVADDDPGRLPLVQYARPDEERGRGLALVDHLASAWGTTWLGGASRATGKSVWFELRDKPETDQAL